MIIDSHVHLCGEPYSKENLTINYPEGGSRTMPFLREQFHPDFLIGDMDKNKIHKAVVMGMPDAVTNEQLDEIVKNSSGRFIGFAGVRDPKSPESIQVLDKAVKEQGMKGLKLHTDFHSISPSNPEIVPLVVKATELRVPVLFHCYPGLIRNGYFNKNKPEHFDTLKKMVPDAKIIIAHMAWPRYLDLLTIAQIQGVYVDTSFGLPNIAELNGLDYTVKYLRMIGIENVLYASDWNGSMFSKSMQDQVELIKKLPLTGEEKEKILERNISELLEL